MQDLSTFLGKGTAVWSNGAAFDQPLLDVAYCNTGIHTPWDFRKGFCYRTMVNLCKNSKQLRPVSGVKHNALADAKWQAEHLIKIIKELRLEL